MDKPDGSEPDSVDSSQVEEGQVDQEARALNDTGEHPEKVEELELEQGSRPGAPEPSYFPEEEESPGPEGEAFDGVRGSRGERGLLSRISGIGITLVIVLALLYIVKDIVPPALVERVATMAGLEEWIPLGSGLEAKPGTAQEAYGTPSAMETSILDAAAGEWAGNKELQEQTAVAPATESTSVEGGVEGPAEAVPREQEFPVRFMHNSELLETEAWHVLDSVALVLRQEPDSIAIIRDEASSAQSEELLLARTTVVERYLVAAGVASHRVQVGKPESSVSGLEEGTWETDEAVPGYRIVTISIEGAEL